MFPPDPSAEAAAESAFPKMAAPPESEDVVADEKGEEEDEDEEGGGNVETAAAALIVDWGGDGWELSSIKPRKLWTFFGLWI